MPLSTQQDHLTGKVCPTVNPLPSALFAVNSSVVIGQPVDTESTAMQLDVNSSAEVSQTADIASTTMQLIANSLAGVGQPKDTASTAMHNIGQRSVSALTPTVFSINSSAAINQSLATASITTLCTVNSLASGQPTDHTAVSLSVTGQQTSITGASKQQNNFLFANTSYPEDPGSDILQYPTVSVEKKHVKLRKHMINFSY